METNYKFIVTLTLFLIGGLVSKEIKAQAGSPMYQRMERTNEEIKRILRKDVALLNVYAQNINETVKAKKFAYTNTITQNHIGYILDNTIWVKGSEVKSKYNIFYVYNGFRKNGQIDMSSYELIDDGETYGLWNCGGFGYIIWIKGRCLNPEKEAIAQVQQKTETTASNNSYQNQNILTTTTTNTTEECYEMVLEKQTYYVQFDHLDTYNDYVLRYNPCSKNGMNPGTILPSGNYVYHPGVGLVDHCNDCGNDQTYYVKKTRQVWVKRPCGTVTEELPVAYGDEYEEQETQKRVKEKRPVYIQIGVGFAFYRQNGGLVNGGTNQVFTPVTPGGQGGFQSVTPGKQGGDVVVTPGAQGGGFQAVTPGKRLGEE